MHTLCNRYNSAKVLAHSHSWGNSMTHSARWQVSVEDSRGHAYDYFFVAKPTRKQIRKLHNRK